LDIPILMAFPKDDGSTKYRVVPPRALCSSLDKKEPTNNRCCER